MDKDTKTFTEYFLIIPGSNKNWKASVLQLTFDRFEVHPEFDSIFINETLSQVKKHLIHNIIDPVLTKRSDLLIKCIFRRKRTPILVLFGQ